MSFHVYSEADEPAYLSGANWPAVALEVALAVLLEHEQAGCLRVGEDSISIIGLQVRVDDGDHVASGRLELTLHRERIRELELVPREVAFAVRVLDVQPKHVKGECMLLEGLVDLPHVLLVAVVPTALVVPERKVWRQRRHARDRRVLTRHISG